MPTPPFLSQAMASAAATSITLPTHDVGDLLLIWAYRDGSATPPTTPTASGTVPAWVVIDSTGGVSNSLNHRYFVATANNHTSGTWTNATGIAAGVVKNFYNGSSPIGQHAQTGSTETNTVSGTSITLVRNDGSSLVFEFYAHRLVTAWNAAPSGYTRQTEVATELAINTKNLSTTAGAQAQTCTASSSGDTTQATEILASGIYPILFEPVPFMSPGRL